MKIRTISLLTMLILCLSLLAGCGSGGESSEAASSGAASQDSPYAEAKYDWDDSLIFITRDGDFCFLPDLSGETEAKVLLSSSQATDDSIFELDWDYYPEENTSNNSHYWYSDNGKCIYFVTEGDSTTSPLYVTDATGKETKLICDNVWLSSVKPVGSGLVFSAPSDTSDGNILYRCFDGKITKLADNVSHFGAHKNSKGIYFLRKNTNTSEDSYSVCYVAVDGNSSPKTICKDLKTYGTLNFGKTRDLALYCIAEDDTYTVMMSENGNAPKVLVEGCESPVLQFYDDTFFFSKIVVDKHDIPWSHSFYFDGKKSTDITKSELDTRDSSPWIIDAANHTYFFYNNSTDDPKNPDDTISIFSSIYNGKYIGDILTHGEYLNTGVFMKGSEFAFKSYDADRNDILEVFKLSSDAPAAGTTIAEDPFALKYVKGENALYFMTNTLDDGEYDSNQPATLMCYKNGKCETITDDIYLDHTRIYEDGTVLTFKGEERSILTQYKDGKEKEIGNNIYSYLRLDDGRILFTSDDVLYLYDNGEETRLAENVIRFYSNAGDYGI